jgi:hypothetical protein
MRGGMGSGSELRAARDDNEFRGSLNFVLGTYMKAAQT